MYNNWLMDPEAVPESVEKAREELVYLEREGKKANVQWSFFISVLTIISGVILLIWDEHSGDVGWLLIALGSARFIWSFFKKGFLGRAHEDDHTGEALHNRVKYLRGYLEALDEKEHGLHGHEH